MKTLDQLKQELEILKAKVEIEKLQRELEAKATPETATLGVKDNVRRIV